MFTVLLLSLLKVFFYGWLGQIYIIMREERFFIVAVPALGLSILIKQYYNTGISGFIYNSVISVIITGIIIYLVGINKKERSLINGSLVKFIHTNLKGK